MDLLGKMAIKRKENSATFYTFQRFSHCLNPLKQPWATQIGSRAKFISTDLVDFSMK
jgi:hypothetical protein